MLSVDEPHVILLGDFFARSICHTIHNLLRSLSVPACELALLSSTYIVVPTITEDASAVTVALTMVALLVGRFFAVLT